MPPICPEGLRTTKEDFTGVQHQDCDETTPDLKTEVGTSQDAIPDMEKSGVIYCIPCAECPATYVGETKRKLCKRMDEHKRALRMADFSVSAVAMVWIGMG